MSTDVWELERTTLAVDGIEAAYGYYSDGVTPSIHRGLPSRHLTFILSLDEPVEIAPRETDLRQGRATAHEVIVAGLGTSPTYVHQPRRQRGVQLAVHPLASRRLFGAPASTLSGLDAEGSDVLGPPVTELRDRLHELASWEARFDAVAGYLRTREDCTGGCGQVRPELSHAWSMLQESRGRVPIRTLANTVGLSGRQLTKLFRGEFGLTPKSLARLMRFDHAIALIGQSTRAGHTPLIGDVAARCGYYDQSHLVADFQQFAGAAPSTWLDEEFRNIQVGGHSSSEY